MTTDELRQQAAALRRLALVFDLALSAATGDDVEALTRDLRTLKRKAIALEQAADAIDTHLDDPLNAALRGVRLLYPRDSGEPF